MSDEGTAPALAAACSPRSLVGPRVTVTVFAFDLAGDQIKRIGMVRNPDKLRSWKS